MCSSKWNERQHTEKSKWNLFFRLNFFSFFLYSNSIYFRLNLPPQTLDSKAIRSQDYSCHLKFSGTKKQTKWQIDRHCPTPHTLIWILFHIFFLSVENRLFWPQRQQTNMQISFSSSPLQSSNNVTTMATLKLRKNRFSLSIFSVSEFPFPLFIQNPNEYW